MSHRYRPRPRLGQHFLADTDVIERIVRVIAPAQRDRMLEIGPGRGALTLPLAERVARLVAVELDPNLAARLQRQTTDYPALTVLHADALQVEFATLGLPAPVRLVGNLPYEISTPLLARLMDAAGLFSELTVMVQREVATRLAADPGSKRYGRLSVGVQWQADVDLLFDVPPDCFDPAPRIMSTLVQIRPRPPHLALQDPQALRQILAAAFGQRRKQLQRSLKAMFSPQALETLGVDPSWRAEQVSVDTYLRLANDWAERRCR